MVGLSPRERGNPGDAGHGPAQLGSIPARAGEPLTGPMAPAMPPVYPRASGGTATGRDRQYQPVGLSPRERGNQAVGRHLQRYAGSIPARAGEPRSAPAPPSRSRVYPRASGGTARQRRRAHGIAGLSPRERGNLPFAGRDRDGVGSIPARAGEPRRPTRWLGSARVYPRASGGTPSNRKASTVSEGLSPRERGNRGAGAELRGR